MFRSHWLDSSLLISKFSYIALRALHPPSWPCSPHWWGAVEAAGTRSTHLPSLTSHHPASPGPSLSLHSGKTCLSGSSLSLEAPVVSPCTPHTPWLFLYTGTQASASSEHDASFHGREPSERPTSPRAPQCLLMHLITQGCPGNVRVRHKFPKCFSKYWNHSLHRDKNRTSFPGLPMLHVLRK